MPVAKAVEIPIVGRRSPEMQRLVEMIQARVGATGRMRSRRSRVGIRPRMRQPRAAVDSELNSADLGRVVVVNALAEHGSLTPGTVTRLVRTARLQEPERAVLVVLDEGNPDAVRAARNAGAGEFLGRDEIQNAEAVVWRFWNASFRRHAGTVLDDAAPANPVALPSFTVRTSGRLSASALEAADAAIEEAVGKLPTAAERRNPGPSLLEVVAPALRAAESGRLDARRIAAATEMPLAALARASGVSQQALSATPDSPGAQAGLFPIARLSELLDELFTPEQKRVWLQTPHPRFGGRSPVQAIEQGDAELVALSVEGALEGLPD